MRISKIHVCVVIGIVSLLAVSCGIFEPNLARRYRNIRRSTIAEPINGNPQTFVTAEVNSYISKETTVLPVKHNLLSLSDEGQKSFIDNVAKFSKDADGMLRIINSNFYFDKTNSTNVKAISKIIKRSLVFTVDKKAFTLVKDDKITIFNFPGERIDKLYLEVVISEGKAKFSSWDKFLSDLLSLNLGKASSAQNWDASLNLSAKGGTVLTLNDSNSTEDSNSSINSNTKTKELSNFKKESNNQITTLDKTTGNTTTGMSTTADLGGTATVGYKGSYETSLDLTQQILKLSGTLRDNSLTLFQESGPGIDLSGNVTVSLDYELLDDWATPEVFIGFKDLYDSADKPYPVKDVNFTNKIIMFPDIKENICGELDYSFLYRQVLKGGRHLPEARQKVKLRSGYVSHRENKRYGENSKEEIVLIDKNDVRPKAFLVVDSETFISLKYKNREIKFETMNEAATFLKYLYDAIDLKIDTSGLVLGINNLNNQNIANLKIITKQL